MRECVAYVLCSICSRPQSICSRSSSRFKLFGFDEQLPRPVLDVDDPDARRDDASGEQRARRRVSSSCLLMRPARAACARRLAGARCARADCARALVRTGAHELADEREARPRMRRNVRQARVRLVAARFARHETFDDAVLERVEADDDEPPAARRASRGSARGRARARRARR